MPLLLSTILLLTACTTTRPAPPTAVLADSPLFAAQGALGWAVFAENLEEDPEEDAKTRTALESVYDAAGFPWTLIRGYAALTGALAWTLADFPLHGYEPGTFQRRAHRLLDAIPGGSAGPPPTR